MINYIWMSFKAYLSCYHLLYTQAHSHVGLWVLWPSFYGPQSPQVQLGPNLVVAAILLPYLDHFAEGDESDEGVLREEGERHLEGLLERAQLHLVHARVHHDQEDGRHRRRPEQRGA